MRRILFSVLALVVLVAARPAPADSHNAKPIVVMSCAGYDAMMDDVKCAGEMMGNPDLHKGVETMLKLFTRGEGLAGIDKGRPWGAAIFCGGDKPIGYGFVPVKDFRKTIALMEKMGPELKRIGHGMIEVDTNHRGRKAYIRESHGWAFVSDNKAILERVPADPAKLLAGLPDRYDWAVRLNVCNVPEKQRDKMLAEMKKHARRHLEHMRGSEREMAIRKMIAKRIVELVDHAAHQIEQVTAGWALDSSEKKAYFELTITAMPGTEFARQFEGQRDLTSNFAGFVLPDAAVKCGFTAQCTAVDPVAVADLFSEIRDAAFEKIDDEMKGDKAKHAKLAVNEILRVVGETTASGHADGGMSARLTPDGMTVVCGRYVASAERLQKVLRIMADHARREHPEKFKKCFKPNADQFQGVSMHVVSIPVPKECPAQKKAIRLVGKNFDMVLGFGKDAIYFAAGKDAVPALKRAINRSRALKDKHAPPLHFTVSLHQLATFGAEVGKERDRNRARKAAAILAKSDGKDHINVTAAPIKRGMRYRMELEEGVLQLMIESRKLRSMK